jgi:hypothetical protein
VAFAMHLDIHYIYIHSKSNIPIKIKTPYNITLKRGSTWEMKKKTPWEVLYPFLNVSTINFGASKINFDLMPWQ